MVKTTGNVRSNENIFTSALLLDSLNEVAGLQSKWTADPFGCLDSHLKAFTHRLHLNME